MDPTEYVRPTIVAMAGYQPGEQPQGGDFIKLNTNENPYPPSPQVIDAIVRQATDRLRRYPDPMAGEFRHRAAELLGVGPDWILAGNGCDDILTIVTRTFLGPGDLAISSYPSYILYTVLAQLQDARCLPIPFTPDWGIPPGFAHPGARLAFLTNPNSPSGTMCAPDLVSNLATRLTCPLLVDEAYVDFADAHCIDLVRRHPNVIVGRTLSKSYALAGARFGYAVAQPALIAQMVKVKDSYNCNALSIAAATAAIGDQPWMRDSVARIRRTRSRLTDAMRRFGFTVPPSQANFVWCTRRERGVRPIYEQLKRRKVLVRYMDYANHGDGLRITVGTDAEVDRLIEELQALV